MSILDYEEPINYLVKFYKVAGTLGAQGNKDVSLFMRLFLHYLFRKIKYWYLDQLEVVTTYDKLEHVEISRFFSRSHINYEITSIDAFEPNTKFIFSRTMCISTTKI